MKKIFILSIVLFFAPMCLTGQVLNSFDAQVDTVWFQFSKGEASSDTSEIVQTLDTQNQIEGDGCMRVEYNAENSESWGGFAKLEHIKLEAGTYDWSAYDSISFWYNNVTKQDDPGRVHLRFNIYDVSEFADTLTESGDMEFYYSFQYILDNEPGWTEIKIPLLDGRGVPDLDEWGGGAFNRTGWNGPAGNDKLDTDKIRGFGFEFSISTGPLGGAAGDRSQGVVLIDDFRLKGSKNVISNWGFEDDLTGWSSDQGGGYIQLGTGDAYAGDNYIELGVNDNAWAVAFTDGTVTTKQREWQLSAYIKDISSEYPGGDFGALKLEAKDESGAVLASIETIGVGITTDWQLFSTSLIMPEGTATVTPVLVATKWSGDGKTAAYGFDNVVLLDLGVSDLEPPIAPTGVLASSDAENFFNLVVWQDVDGESDETYSVYASTNPITNVDDPGVELLASGVKEEVKQVIHYLFYPLHDQEVTYYYAVACTDRAGNTGPAGNAGSATVNTAKAVPTISLDVPATFAADGDLSEWDDSDITPFEMSPETHYVVGGAVTDAADLSATVYLAVDDDFLYIAADVIDDVYHFSAGNWWEKDAFECFIGLYDSRSGKHNTYKGADEPDYKLFMTENNLSRDPGGKELYLNNTDNFYLEGFNPDYAFEAKVSLDSIGQDGDTRFHPLNGMRIPFELYIHDNDGSGHEGNLAYSPLNTDQAHNNPQQWGYTWIGDTNQVVSAVEDKPGFQANSYELKQNYPNPFNPATTIQYNVAKAGTVTLKVFNLLGQEVEVLVDARHTAGTHLLKFDASKYSSGVYFYQIQAGSFVETRKMLLVK